MERTERAYSMQNVSADRPSVSSSLSSSTDLGSTKEKRSCYSVCVSAVDLVNQVLIIFMTIFLLYYSLREISEMNLHVALCTIGFVLLTSEAIVVLAGDESILTNFLSRRAKIHVHWVLQLLGLIFNIVGIGFMYVLKKRHFLSIHAILGLVAVIIMIVLSVLGYPVFIAGKLRKFVRPVVLKFCHNFLGTACFVIGMASQCYGYKTSWLPWVAPNVPNVQAMCIIVTSIIIVLSLRGALPTLGRQFVSLFR